MPSVGTRAVELPRAPGPDADEHGVDQQRSHPRSPPRWLVVTGLAALVGLPLIVATMALRRPHWYPVLDLAMTELRLRDVGTRHTPLIGLPGRIGPSLAEQGSHPGPLSFYLLAPLYRVFGSSAWSMQAATVVVHLAAVVAALALAARRGGARVALAVAAAMVFLIAGYGLTVLTQPWNPYLPLLWWVVLLLATWSVVCGDVAMLPVAVAAGSLCAQTHVPYLGLAVGLGAVAAAGALAAWRRTPAGSASRRNVARWVAGALAVGVALWVPPLVDQAVNDPGNLRAIYDHLVGSPTEEPVGVVRGVELALVRLNAGRLVEALRTEGSLVRPSAAPGSLLPGIALLVVWAAAAAVSLRARYRGSASSLGSRALVGLHLVVAAALLVGASSMGRILGLEWFYLMLWASGVTALLLLAVGWTVVAAIDAGAPGGKAAEGGDRRRFRRPVVGAATLGLLVAVVAGSAASTADALDTEPPEPHLSRTLGALVPDTVAALERGVGAAAGREGRYSVIWNDALHFGSQGYGMVNELERAGFDAGAPSAFHVPITNHRVIEPDDATAVVVLANGGHLARWRALPEAVEVASVEPPASVRAEFARLRAAVIDDLGADGLDELVPMVDGNLFGASIDERVSSGAQRRMARMLELGAPTAVFIAPPGASP
jgi:hypothetical protein